MYLLRRAWSEIRNEVFVLPSRTLVLVWAAGLLLLPFFYSDAYALRILTMTCIFAIFAASWDLLAGYTGQVNFGHALFFGVGAYTSGLMSLKLGLSPWLTIWAGAAVALLSGFLVGYLMYDMGHYHIHHHRSDNRLSLALRRYHYRHHFQQSDRGYGVTSGLWDYVFRTVPAIPRRRQAA